MRASSRRRWRAAAPQSRRRRRSPPPRVSGRVLRTRDLAAAACGEAGALGEQLRGLVKAKKVVPAPLQLHLLKRVMAGADAAASDDVAVDLLTDFPRSAGQLNQLEHAVGKVLWLRRAA